MTITLDGTTGITTPTTSTTGEFVTSVTGFKNRIINGAMVIDQRNAGASVTPTNGQYLVDRFAADVSQASKFTAQQSSTAPAGFTNSLLITSSSAYSIGAGDYFTLHQFVEGYNTSDFNFGTASALSIVLSFWVRSSLTGTFGGSFRGASNSRSYPFTYTINSANTWEQKTIPVVGDTSGTWVTNNGVGIGVFFGLGVGSSNSGTAGSWQSINAISATGATSVVGTSGATFYITGVQLEKGSTATSFDYRPYGTELFLCQRYYENSYGVGYAVGSANSYPNNQGVQFQGFNTTSGQKHVYDWFKVPKRVAPTVTYYDYAGTSGKFSSLDSGGTATNGQAIGYTPLNQNNLAVGSTSTYYGIAFFWTASAEL